jgi:predicted nucleic acid-binding protein
LTKVVADSGPLHYFVLIDTVAILPQLFGDILIPGAVERELSRPGTPRVVRDWLATSPSWLSVRDPPSFDDPAHAMLGSGERAAIALAKSEGEALMLIDDRAAVVAARLSGFTVAGTLGVLLRAAQRDLIDLGEAFHRLKLTNFRYRRELLDGLLSNHEAARN